MGLRLTGAFAAVSLVLALFSTPAAGSIEYEYWVESQLMRGDRWDFRYAEGDYPATATWEGVSGGTGEFGANRTASTSAISDDLHFAYAYADATWQDTVTIYDPSRPIGSMMELFSTFRAAFTSLRAAPGRRARRWRTARPFPPTSRAWTSASPRTATTC
ncbi:MAG: hypothetical protein ACYTAN_16145 [Planctomycetota bacterium]|jgi:hypothetical protein